VIFGSVTHDRASLGVIVLVLVVYFGVTFVQIWLTGHDHSTKSAQAILVFGTTEDNGTPSPELKARLDQALSLYDAGRAPVDRRHRWASDPATCLHRGRSLGDVFRSARRAGVAHIEGAGSDTWQNVSTIIGKLTSAPHQNGDHRD
jgi:hypothetical protein